jgi:hypothetical protein
VTRRPFGLTLRVERLPAITPEGRSEVTVLHLGDADGDRDVVLEPNLETGSVLVGEEPQDTKPKG